MQLNIKMDPPARKDSVVNKVMDPMSDYKKMKIGNPKWAKVDKMMSKDSV